MYRYVHWCTRAPGGGVRTPIFDRVGIPGNSRELRIQGIFSPVFDLVFHGPLWQCVFCAVLVFLRCVAFRSTCTDRTGIMRDPEMVGT